MACKYSWLINYCNGLSLSGSPNSSNQTCSQVPPNLTNSFVPPNLHGSFRPPNPLSALLPSSLLSTNGLDAHKFGIWVGVGATDEVQDLSVVVVTPTNILEW